jgi:hypothetical protein
MTNMDTMLSSEFRSRLLAKCFEKTRGGEDHCALEEVILSRTRGGTTTRFIIRSLPPNSS